MSYYHSDKPTKTAEDYYQEGFTRSLITDLEHLHNHPEAWEKPALSNADLCPAVNPFGDKGVTVYRGRNQINLKADTAAYGHSMAVYLTINQLKKFGTKTQKATWQKGSHLCTVTHYEPGYRDKNHKFYKEEDYQRMSLAARKGLTKSSMIHHWGVINIDYTNLRELNPALYQRLQNSVAVVANALLKRFDSSPMYFDPAFEKTMENWQAAGFAPVKEDPSVQVAAYIPGANIIECPSKERFMTGRTPLEKLENGLRRIETLIHECMHSTGPKLRPDKIHAGLNDYHERGREELVAQIGTYMICSEMGLPARILRNGERYIDGWLKNIKEDPNFIKDVMADAAAARNEFVKVYDAQAKALGQPTIDDGRTEEASAKTVFEELMARQNQQSSPEKAPESAEKTAEKKPEAAIQTESPVGSQLNMEAPAAVSRSAEPQKTGSVRDTEAVTVSVLHDTDGNGVVNLSDAANQDALIDAMARSANPGLKDADIKKIADCLKIIAAQTHTGPMKTDARARPLGGNNEPPRDQDRGPRGRGGRE